MEPIPPVVLRKLWNMTRLMLFTLRKGVSKTKLTLDLHLLIQRGKVARKALSNLMLHHHSSSKGGARDPHVPFVYPPPGEYEFSCSSTPVWQAYNPFHPTKRTKSRHSHMPSHDFGGDDTAAALEMLEESAVFERSVAAAAGRQLRITDSPFPVMEGDEDDSHVDEAAEEFIERFYRNLRLQRGVCGAETPCHDN